jgi:ABC-type branched-subunit amino acid transport system substrate-binding protein
VAAVLVASGCGARWSDAQEHEVLARRAPVTRPAAASSSSAGAAAAAPVAGVVGPAATAPGATPTSGVATAAAGAVPCAARSTAPGVAGGRLTVGAISSLSGPVPGLGASSGAAVRAYVAYRNSTGGVCGRKIVLKEADDGTDNGRYRSVLASMAPDVLGLVGGFALGDVGGVDVVEQAALPVVNVPSGDAVTALPTAFDLNPPYQDLHAVIGKYRFLRSQGASKAILVYLAVDQSRAEANIQRSLMEAAGIRVVGVKELPVATLSYDSAARSVANSGADYLFFIGDARANASMAQAMADAGAKPKVAEYFSFAYATPFAELAGAAAEGATTWLRTLPNEDAGSNPELATYLRWMRQVAPDDVTDVFAADAWAAAKAFFDALQGLPGPITREALVAKLRSVDTYDAAGMMGPIRLGAERTRGCVVGMQVEAGRWRRLAPATGFLC